MLGAKPARRESYCRRSRCCRASNTNHRSKCMTRDKRHMEVEDLRVMYDLSIYNCLHFDPYTALIYEDIQQQEVREYTNVQIAREATQLAAGLRALGIEKGDRVIVMMLNCPEVIVSYQAISRAGAVIIPVMPLLKAPEVHYIAQNSAAKAIITSPILLPLLHAALAGVPAIRYIISTGDEGIQPTKSDAPYDILLYTNVVERGSASGDDYLGYSEGIDLI